MNGRGHPPTSPRDQDATSFTGHLESLLRDLPEAVCAVFVDGEGETVDLATRLDPFDARIAGAEMSIILHAARRTRERLAEGAVLELRIEGNARSVIARMVSRGYDLVVMVQAPAISARVAEVTAGAALGLLLEAGLKPPPSYAVLRSVEQRPSRAGFLVPTAFDEGSIRRKVEAILGHRDDGDGVVKFLVRLEGGEELIVAHDRGTGRWQRA